MRTAVALLWLTGIFEALLGIPFLGGSFILSTGWGALGVMFLLHAVTLFFCIRQRAPKAGPILGLITSVIGIIPILGMVMHWITAIVLFVTAAAAGRQTKQYEVKNRL
ncbi:hypothetical protein [Indiicoccus explosivorum]|uniref:hypothetical protein n=1 Tax=Indiicoccus explosivorum TaxID=1917864 RepID=UPI000B44FB8C|nr:hypothetical protein [Indiicoccus explosivorum]